jgi:hypothetical protein
VKDERAKSKRQGGIQKGFPTESTFPFHHQQNKQLYQLRLK